jgi:isocitrate dehydrogenase
VARGDGIGPEITDAVLHILREAGTPVEFESLELGERAYRAGHSAGIPDAAWATIVAHGVLLKGPITTPQGGGYKSVNVTLRKALGLYANVRPCIALHPYVPSLHPGMDVVIVRENEEDTYGGIEHRQTDEVVQCLKLISRPGCERVIRYAFEYARRHGRRKVTCLTKDNIMKLTDGLFHKVFDSIAGEYPELVAEHRIIDIGAARLATRPRDFDVIVTLNLYGDILSDIAAELAGSIGMAASANIGSSLAMFEAVHGSAPDIAGKNVANPSGLLLAALMMLEHLGEHDTAALIHNAWLRTLEDGLHTADLLNETTSRRCVGTREFAHAVATRLGLQPQRLTPRRAPAAAAAPASAHITDTPLPPVAPAPRARANKRGVGIDVFLDWDEAQRDTSRLAARLQAAAGERMRLALITNRGVRVWPDGHPQTLRTDHWRCRFLTTDGCDDAMAMLALQQRILAAGLDIIKTEHLYTFDGERGYSAAQGE